MPTYVYKCNACEEVFEYFHSFRVKRTTCESCGQESLQKMLNTPINITKTLKKKTTTPGEVIKDTIEQTKEEIKKDKEKLRSRSE
jgi:putative FmdB family regulatory protein